MTNLETAARAIIHQRDFMAESGGEYDLTTYNPDPQTGQQFDDWAADILEAALVADGLSA